jgi:hypothetical protein
MVSVLLSVMTLGAGSTFVFLAANRMCKGINEATSTSQVARSMFFVLCFISFINYIYLMAYNLNYIYFMDYNIAAFSSSYLRAKGLSYNKRDFAASTLL